MIVIRREVHSFAQFDAYRKTNTALAQFSLRAASLPSLPPTQQKLSGEWNWSNAEICTLKN
jgi:hypothetical protein